MKKLRITLPELGKTYIALVEEEDETAAPAAGAVPAAPAAPAAPAPKAAPAPAAPSAPSAPASGAPLKAPMPGTVISVAVKPGDKVEKNQVLLVLEAMKMENDIVAPQAGTVTSVSVKKGDSVNADDVMLTIA